LLLFSLTQFPLLLTHVERRNNPPPLTGDAAYATSFLGYTTTWTANAFITEKGTSLFGSGFLDLLLFAGGGSDEISQLRLIVAGDCLDSNGRFIDYSLVNINTVKSPDGNYTVTENFRNWPNGPHTSDGPNKFGDTQGTLIGLPGATFFSYQHFTISGPDITGNPQIPVRMNGQDFGELGIWKQVPAQGSPYGVVFINGTQAATRATVGQKCAHDYL